jgi:hypothetical protein
VPLVKLSQTLQSSEMLVLLHSGHFGMIIARLFLLTWLV